jgi:hypothetical protein
MRRILLPILEDVMIGLTSSTQAVKVWYNNQYQSFTAAASVVNGL